MKRGSVRRYKGGTVFFDMEEKIDHFRWIE